MKNTAIENFCDKGIVFSICVSIFVLPASIALLDSFAALAIFLFFLKKISQRSFSVPDNVLNRPLQFLSAAVFVSVLFSQYPGLSFCAFVGKYLKVVFLYFSFIEAFRDEKRIRIFLGFFLASAVIAALSGIVQHYTGKDFIKGHFIGAKDTLLPQRVSSTFFSANGFAAYLLPITGILAHVLYSAAVKSKSWICTGGLAFCLGLLLTCLCWTYSRASWIGYLVILFVMVLLDRRKVLFSGALLLVFIFIFLPSLDHVRHMNLIKDTVEESTPQESIPENSVENVQKENTQKESVAYDVKSFLEQGGSGRLAYWKKAVSIIRVSPIYGAGLNTYARIIKRDPNHATWWYAHNSYLQMTAETGLMGLACFLVLLFVLLRYGLSHCRGTKGIWPLTFLQGAISGLFGILVQSFFDNTFYTVQLSMLLWLIFGLTVAVARLNE